MPSNITLKYRPFHENKERIMKDYGFTKLAITDFEVFIKTAQTSPFEAVHPVQPAKIDPAAGFALRFTTNPDG